MAKYRILHIPTGEFVRFFDQAGTKKKTILREYGPYENDEYDFIIPTIVSGEATESYWGFYTEHMEFSTKSIAKGILDLLIRTVNEAEDTDNYVLRNDVNIEEFEIIRV